MFSMNDLQKGYKNEIQQLIKSPKYKLDEKIINDTVTTKDRGIYAFYHNGTLIYIGQGGGNIELNNTSTKLKERLLQYQRPKDSGTKNVKNYLTENGACYCDLEFSFISIDDCRLIKIIELVMIDYFKPQVNK